MAKPKINIGTATVPNNVTLDAQNVDTVDGLHFRINAGKIEYSTDGVNWYKF